MMDRLENIKLGALIGAGMGFLYGISSQIPNLIILRDVHLYSKPFDPFINLLVFALLGPEKTPMVSFLADYWVHYLLHLALM